MTYDHLMQADLGDLVDLTLDPATPEVERLQAREALCARLRGEQWDWLQFTEEQRAQIKTICGDCGV
ncbi:MAG TPA: hypothetical protein PKN52_00135 [Trueperaceae bacterium]|nr:hypothetical protein [Trueperaceae bacterium]